MAAAMVMLMAAGGGTAAEATVRICPAPAGEPLATNFMVMLGQQRAPMYIARVASGDPARRFKAMDDKTNSAAYYEHACFTYFDLQGPTEVTVTSADPIKTVKLLPTSYGINPSVSGNRIVFTLNCPGHVTLEVNDNWVNSLHLFANPPETNAPHQGDPNVIYYGPGIHEVDNVRVTSGQTVYVAGGAVVRGVPKPGGRSLFSLEGENITLRGRGIIDGTLCPTHSRHMVSVRGTNILLEGVILRDSSVWTVPIRRSEQVKVNNLKLLGYRANSDGIDICNSRNVEVIGCFIRTLDDLVVIKADKGQGPVRNIFVHDCVLWNEVAHALSVGAELREDVDQVRFANCDVIHDKGREWTLRVYHCDAARISNVTFENLRIEETKRLISVWIGKQVWSRDPERGHIDGVTFRDIRATGTQPRVELKGFDASHGVTDVKFERVSVNGQPLQAAEVKQNEFVQRVSVKP